MSKRKMVAIGVVSLVILLVGTLAVVLFLAFGSNKPVEHGATYERATVVEDPSYVSMYLVDAGGGKYVLVDGGVDQKLERVKAMLAKKGATADDIIAVVLTHAHADHVGAAYGLTDVPLYVHEADVAVAQGEASTLGTIATTNDPGLTVDHAFKDGDILEFGEAKFEVFHTPGHTAGNSAFLIGGLLLLGDTAQVTKDDQLTAPPTFFSDDPAQAIEAIRALGKEFEAREMPKTMVGSHSGPTTNVAALLEYDGD